MPQFFFWILNILLMAGALWLFSKKGFLSYARGGRWWLTWLAIGVITLMDELTSIFYAPSEAYRYIGRHAIFFIPLTAFFVHFMTTRMVEIAEILDAHGLKGGGVYNFSYFVLGPVISFVAVASIMVAYVLTAAISSVSAVENAGYFFNPSTETKLILEIAAIWGVAGLNILGIRNNTRVTFGIFLVTAIVFINLIVAGIVGFDISHFSVLEQSIQESTAHWSSGGIGRGYLFLIASVSSCILAYSGVESVLQTASLVQNWKIIGRAYIFLAATVGIVIPLVAVMVLSHPQIDVAHHETDLIIHFATLLNGKNFGVAMAVVASVTLLMAINTAFVASSELLERIAHRYGFNWIVETNRFASLYRIHVANALFFSLVIIGTQGQQMALAEMYAVGLVASFVINLLSLLIYRYSMGTKEVRAFNVSRLGTLLFFILMLSCFIYLSYHKTTGFLLWFFVTLISLLIGIYGTRKRAPELAAVEKGETPMDIILYLAESSEEHVNLYFKRPFDSAQDKTYGISLFVTFYSPRQKLPSRISPNHFRIPFKRASIFNNIAAILDLLIYEIPNKNITVHFGWPTSSWFDRLSTGVMVFQFMKFPRLFPKINFKIEKFKSKYRE